MRRFKKKKIILGIDPGLATTGYGLIQKEGSKINFLAGGCIITKASDSLAKRLFIIYQEIIKIIKNYKPDLLAVEELFFAKNVKTALKVSKVEGIIYLTSCLLKIPLQVFTPLQVKQAITGYGRADKIQMQKMVKILLNLDNIPKPDDMADALAIAITCGQTKKFI